MNLEASSSTRILKSRPALADRFEVIEVLGEGASGAVYRVSDRKEHGREVALKILLNNSAFDENTLERFVAELRILQKIRHSNIVEAYDLIDVGETIAFTMEYVRGADLGDLFRENRLDPEQIDNIFIQVLSALEELHNNGIVHRDIKLENILVGDNGVVKLSDLGLMKWGEFDGLTKTGVLLGTAQYMPPEYVRGSQYDQRGDLYAVGLMLYELLTRKRRLSEKSGNEALEYLIKTRFEIPKITLTGLPSRYVMIIDRALETDPKKRFQSAAEMRQAFIDSAGQQFLYEARPESPELKSPEMKRFCELSAISEALDKAAPSRRRGISRRFVMLGLLVAALLGAPYAWKYVSPPVTVESGSYEGEAQLARGNVKVALEITDTGMNFSSSMTDCKSGPVDLSSGKVQCPRQGLQLRIEGQQGTTIRGSLIDLEKRERYKFSVDRIELRPEVSRPVSRK